MCVYVGVTSVMGTERVFSKKDFYRLPPDIVTLDPLRSIVKTFSVRKRKRKRPLFVAVNKNLTNIGVYKIVKYKK